MRGTASGLWRIGWIVRMLIEVVQVGFALALLGLQARPTPGSPTEGSVTSQIASGFGDFVSIGWIGGQQSVGIGAVALVRRLAVSVRCGRNTEAEAFVGVVAHQDRR